MLMNNSTYNKSTGYQSSTAKLAAATQWMKVQIDEGHIEYRAESSGRLLATEDEWRKAISNAPKSLKERRITHIIKALNSNMLSTTKLVYRAGKLLQEIHRNYPVVQQKEIAEELDNYTYLSMETFRKYGAYKDSSIVEYIGQELSLKLKYRTIKRINKCKSLGEIDDLLESLDNCERLTPKRK